MVHAHEPIDWGCYHGNYDVDVKLIILFAKLRIIMDLFQS